MRFDDLRRELALVEGALASVDPGVDTSSLVERKAVTKLQLDSVVYPDVDKDRPFTPALWTDLSTGYDGSRNNVTIEAVMQGIDRWFGRASALPISLYFWGDSEKWYTYVKTLLHQQASRLDTLRLVDTFDASALGEPVYFPNLRSLTLERTCSDALITTFRDSPRLREVNFSAGIRVGPRNVALPWHQLTTFSAKYMLIVDCLKVLRDCPRLRKCSLEGIHDAEHWPVSPTVHQALEELSIESSSAEILHFLDLPALRALTLKGVIIWGALFNDFLRRSSNSLRALTYTENVPSHVISLEWFRIANRLVEVTLTTIEADFIQTLLLELDRSVHPKFLPDLHHLEVASTHHFTIDAPIIAALQSRRPPVIAGLEGESDAATVEPNAATVESNGTTVESNASDHTIEYEVETATLESLCLIRLCSNYDLDWEEIGEIDWDALSIMGEERMDIYVGSEKENFLWEW
ncbi:hypothetical protein B0H16DRAFT_1551056 [Mycena metata]|uniref:F-box domain-containing protein n=1 Tax=Mycena metata TaxID=1033252 RepID=A0AAD7IVR0_9AGAR|nr:hypothetical protein B0H16DRAFT_1551056 [Mycena metata]